MKSILLLLIITLLGCSSNKKQEPISKSGVPVINLSEDVSTVPSLLLSESAEKLEIVPLEMTDQSMLGEIRRIQVTEHDIWIHDFNKFYIYQENMSIFQPFSLMNIKRRSILFLITMVFWYIISRESLKRK